MARKPSRQTKQAAEKRTKKTNNYAPQHPMNNASMHEMLLKHIKARLNFANEVRSGLIERFKQIDIELSGFVAHSANDKKRERDNKAGMAPKPTAVNLELTSVQLDEEVTFLMEVFAPDTGMFEASARPDEQPIANAFAALLNKSAQKEEYYRHIALGLLISLKYNFGGWQVYWERVHGVSFKDTAGTLSFENKVIWQGNALKPLDMYNFLWDVSVHPVDVAKKGEFFATVDLFRHFQIQKWEAEGKLFDTYKYLKSDGGTAVEYYERKPEIRQATAGATGETDWRATLSQSAAREVVSGVEIVDYYGWVNPKDFKLSDDDELQIWRITVANGEFITFTEHLNNVHGMLPVCITVPREDNLGIQSRSYGELLIPLNRFASFKINVDQAASRKRLYGLTIYNSSVLSLDELGDDVVARIPTKPQAADYDLNRAIKHFDEAPDTSNTLSEVANIIDLMQKMLPTDQMRQVTDLQRATMYQAAAAVQGTHRRSRKLALIINDQAMGKMRFQMMYNIFQYQESVEFIDDKTGQVVKIDPSEMRGAEIEFSINDGLRGVDRLIVSEVVKDVLMAVLQSKEASAEIDVVRLLDYYTSLIGDKTDLTQFRRQQPQQPQQPPGAQMNAEQQMLQQSGQQLPPG